MARKDDDTASSPGSGAGFAAGVALSQHPLDPRAATYLEKLTALAELQAEDIRREDRVRHWSLRVRHISDILRLGLELAVALILIAIAAAILGAIWTATHDNGLVIESFSVPPDMAARGLTGQVVAAELEDKLVAMQNATDSARPAASYSNDWGSDIKVEIPDTGVSIGQAYRYLAGWLGHETHIGGDVFRAQKGIAVTARIGGDASARVSGAETDLDTLLETLAERIYERTQPYRYAIYVQSKGAAHIAEARKLLEGLAATSSPRERAWAYVGLGNLDQPTGDRARAVGDFRTALSLEPELAVAAANIDNTETTYGHDEAALAAAKQAVAILDGESGVDMTESTRVISEVGEKINIAFALGDFAGAHALALRAATLPNYGNSVDTARMSVLLSLAQLHDRAGYEAWLAQLPPPAPRQSINRMATEALSQYAFGDWRAVIAGRARVESLVHKLLPGVGVSEKFIHDILARGEWPYDAVAMAMTGDVKGAHALIDQTPRDCYACLRSRGDIDAAEKNWGGAAYWYGRATEAAPSLPLAYVEWGRMLLAKGDTAGATAKFSHAHDLGPRDADALAWWGEALMAENRSDLALAKFSAANARAPHWGRLHLKWAEALFYAGEKNDVSAQLALASSLPLSPAERAELAAFRKKV